MAEKLEQYKQHEKSNFKKIKVIQDDEELLIKSPTVHEAIKGEREREKYMRKIRSQSYRVNIQEIEDDVEKIGEFMVLYVAEQPQEMIKSYSWMGLEEMNWELDSMMSGTEVEMEEI